VSAFTDRFTAVVVPRHAEQLANLVTLSRGAAVTAGVSALWEEPEAEVDDTKTVQTQHVDRLWIIGRTAYVIGGSAVLPAPGDRITDAAGDVWELMRDGRKPHYAPYGQDRWVVRTKRVG
jgi:hypothetical protein